ncbi:MAG: response regulator transcription factor [Spirochaetes bacterium]|nr:response regulator transcription factor [Spirochaetota bacterium]
MHKNINVVIVDDHPVFCMGLQKIINQEKDMKVIGEAHDVVTGFDLIKKTLPDIAIIDITLKDGNGLLLIHDISKHFPKVKSLVVSMHDERIYAQRALQAGAYGYIMKSETSESIIKALRVISRGEVYVSPSVVKDIVFKIVKKTNEVSPLEILTEKEIAVLELIGKGFTTKEIAQALHISTKTVGTYKERIKEKLQLENAVQLVYYATKWMEDPSSLGKKPTEK